MSSSRPRSLSSTCPAHRRDHCIMITLTYLPNKSAITPPACLSSLACLILSCLAASLGVCFIAFLSVYIVLTLIALFPCLRVICLTHFNVMLPFITYISSFSPSMSHLFLPLLFLPTHIHYCTPFLSFFSSILPSSPFPTLPFCSIPIPFSFSILSLFTRHINFGPRLGIIYASCTKRGKFFLLTNTPSMLTNMLLWYEWLLRDSF